MRAEDLGPNLAVLADRAQIHEVRRQLHHRVERRPSRVEHQAKVLERLPGLSREVAGPDKAPDLVSALATVIGWESFIVLLDVRGLTPTAAHRVTRDAAVALVDAALSRAG